VSLGAVVAATLDELVECLRQQIDEAGQEAPCFLTPLPGADVAMDYCGQCDGGMAWVRMQRVAYPDEVVPGMSKALNVVVEMGWISGAPPMVETTDGFELPTADEQRAAMLAQMDQMDLMLRALTCCPLSSGWRVDLGGYEPVGPQGGCVGGIWTATLLGD
jgi:hypothetical protein